MRYRFTESEREEKKGAAVSDSYAQKREESKTEREEPDCEPEKGARKDVPQENDPSEIEIDREVSEDATSESDPAPAEDTQEGRYEESRTEVDREIPIVAGSIHKEEVRVLERHSERRRIRLGDLTHRL